MHRSIAIAETACESHIYQRTRDKLCAGLTLDRDVLAGLSLALSCLQGDDRAHLDPSICSHDADTGASRHTAG